MHTVRLFKIDDLGRFSRLSMGATETDDRIINTGGAPGSPNSPCPPPA
jgi:hypothetical protein